MSDSREQSPSTEERRKKDAEDRKREEEEQSKLPYKWTQTLTEAEVTVPIAGNLKSRDLIVELKKTHLKVAVKGQEPIIDVCGIRLCSRGGVGDTNWLKGRFSTLNIGRRQHMDIELRT